MSGVAAIVLAAGQGTRFGPAPKLLATLDGTPLVRRVAEAALASSASPVFVVLGHRRPEVASALDGLALRFVDNPAFEEGLATSLKAAFARIGAADGAIVLLGDMPLVTASLIDQLIAAWRSHRQPPALVPTYDGRRGNPVILSRALSADIERLSGDAGAGAMLRARTDVVELAIEDPAILRDVDTPATLAGLRAAARG